MALAMICGFGVETEFLFLRNYRV